jgi:phosphonate transport system permease protein
VLFGVLPQVLARFVGFCTYQLDSNLRNSTMVGIVGAGGIGGALFSAFQRFRLRLRVHHPGHHRGHHRGR